jgi:hypothetical protein
MMQNALIEPGLVPRSRHGDWNPVTWRIVVNLRHIGVSSTDPMHDAQRLFSERRGQLPFIQNSPRTHQRTLVGLRQSAELPPTGSSARREHSRRRLDLSVID